MNTYTSSGSILIQIYCVYIGLVCCFDLCALFSSVLLCFISFDIGSILENMTNVKNAA